MARPDVDSLDEVPDGWLDPRQRPAPYLPSLWTIASYWLDEGKTFVVDIDYPNCFACFTPAVQDMRPIEAIPDLRERWRAITGKLERGHLVNRARNGLDGPQNLVPLCHACNKIMPVFDSPLPPGPIEWVQNGGCAQYLELGPGPSLRYRPDWARELNAAYRARVKEPAIVRGVPTV